MTLGGLALAVGILVDDATVTIENIERYLEEGSDLREAILDGAAQIAVPALVSTLCICIVFVPMFLLERRRALSVRAAGRSGGLRHAGLLRPFAHAGADPGDVSAAGREHHGAPVAQPARAGFSTDSSAASSGCAARYHALLAAAGRRRGDLRSGLSCACCWRLLRWCPGSARTSFPTPTAASSCCTCGPRPARGSRRPRASPTRSRTSSAADPGQRHWTASSTTSACPTAASTLHAATPGLIGAADADIMVALKPDHRPTARVCARAARRAAARISRA